MNRTTRKTAIMKAHFPRVVLVALALSTLESAAWADFESPLERESLFAGQPAVRHRREYRLNRFVIGPSIAMSINRAYRHAVMFGAKLQYNIFDWLAVGGEFAGGINFPTAFSGEVEGEFTEAEWEVRKSRLSEMVMTGDVRAVFTPFAGKISIFSALFLAYDFYVFGGFGMAMLTNGNEQDATAEDDVDATNTGFRPGVAWGVGANFYINNFMAVGIEAKDLIFADNETGGDFTRGLTDRERTEFNSLPVVDGDDTSFSNHFFVGLNLTFQLPPRLRISD